MIFDDNFLKAPCAYFVIAKNGSRDLVNVCIDIHERLNEFTRRLFGGIVYLLHEISSP